MNPKAFFDCIRATFGPLSQAQVDGYNALLAEFVTSQWQDPRWLAYLFATAWHETDFTMQPVKEAFWMDEAWRERNLRYFPWYGRGFVQLTWATNYERADHELGLGGTLIHHPEYALNMDIAAQVIFRGMAEGWFTGKKLGDYIYGKTCNYVDSRRIVNGLDSAAAIAVYAGKFEKCVKALEIDDEKRISGSSGQGPQELHPEGDQEAGSIAQGSGGATGPEDPGGQGSGSSQAAGQSGSTGSVRPDSERTQQMSNPLLDQARKYVDQIDDTLKMIDAEIDQVENFPFISSFVGPVGKVVDTVLAIADQLRATIDQLDPIVPPVPPKV